VNQSRICIGVFVGGRGSRMGGAAKGLLALPSGERLLDRLLGEAHAALPEASTILVGAAAAYASFALGALDDDPPGIGPLGGLTALLAHAQGTGHDAVLALACDLPFVSRTLLSRLSMAAPGALAVAPRRDGRWEPLCARYAVAALPLAREAVSEKRHSLQSLFARFAQQASELSLSDSEQRELFDWDTPEDMGA